MLERENCGGKKYNTNNFCDCSDCLLLHANNMKKRIPEYIPDADLELLRKYTFKLYENVEQKENSPSALTT